MLIKNDSFILDSNNVKLMFITMNNLNNLIKYLLMKVINRS